MEALTLQMAAGSISSLLFVTGNIPMLLKAYRTKDLRSYSLSNILLVNVGNLLYWFYVSSLPFGPVWLLHSFYTVTPQTIKKWRQAALVIGHAYNDKPACLYELPTGDAVPSKQIGHKLSTRPHPTKFDTNPTEEVQHEL